MTRRDGQIICHGKPDHVMTSEVLMQAFSIDAEIIRDPRTGKPVCITYDILPSEEKETLIRQ